MTVITRDRPERKPRQRAFLNRILVAFVIAAISDAVSFWTELIPPIQWCVDVATALLLFLVLGRRWALLPGLIAEAIPGMAVFPIWLAVVLSIFVYDEIRLPAKSLKR